VGLSSSIFWFIHHQYPWNAFEPILPGMVNWEKAAELRSLGNFRLNITLSWLNMVFCSEPSHPFMVFLSKKPGFGSSRQVNPDNAVDPLPLPFSIIDEAVGTSGHQDTNQDTKRLRKI